MNHLKTIRKLYSYIQQKHGFHYNLKANITADYCCQPAAALKPGCHSARFLLIEYCIILSSFLKPVRQSIQLIKIKQSEVFLNITNICDIILSSVTA